VRPTSSHQEMNFDDIKHDMKEAREESKEGPKKEKRRTVLDALFKTIDANHNGSISASELSRYLENNPDTFQAIKEGKLPAGVLVDCVPKPSSREGPSNNQKTQGSNQDGPSVPLPVPLPVSSTPTTSAAAKVTPSLTVPPKPARTFSSPTRRPRSAGSAAAPKPILNFRSRSPTPRKQPNPTLIASSGFSTAAPAISQTSSPSHYGALAQPSPQNNAGLGNQTPAFSPSAFSSKVSPSPLMHKPQIWHASSGFAKAQEPLSFPRGFA